MTTTNPTLLSVPIAQNGNKNTIPTTQATAGNGLMSQSTGFPPETSLPLGAGGVAPKREDFNGAFNLLGGVAFYAQKGWTFNYDATQDYYKGCVVIDPSDGKRYECIADMAAGTIAPHDDTANTYWTIFKSGLDREQIPAFNHRDVITTSGTYTAPVDGWYKITVKGGGGGGAGGYNNGTAYYYSAAGGGEGGTTIGLEHLDAGDTVSVVVGAGGAGGPVAGSGLDGGATTVTVNNNSYVGGGGGGGKFWNNMYGGTGGTGTIYGNAGNSGNLLTVLATGAAGGGSGSSSNYAQHATQGGGGAGGNSSANGNTAGCAGGNGYAVFEYFDPTLM